MSISKILVVDDLEVNLSHAKSLLSRTRCTVITAKNGREALGVIKVQRPNLVLMDLYMPEMNGDECCRIIKSVPDLKDIPIVMFTIARETKDRDRCFAAGCDDYFTKPITDSDLFFKRIRKYVDIPVRDQTRVAIDAEIRFYISGAAKHGKLINISNSGGFIETGEDIPLGSIINIQFTIPNTPNKIEVIGEVVRKRAANPESPSSRIIPGIGLRFIGISWDGKKALSDFISSKERKRLIVG